MLYLITYSIVINDEPNFVEQDIDSIAVDTCNKLEAIHHFIENDDESFRSFMYSLFGTTVFHTLPNEKLVILRNLFDEMDLDNEIQYDGFFSPTFTEFIEEHKRDILDILSEYIETKVSWFKVKKLEIITPLGGFTKACYTAVDFAKQHE